MIALLDYGAGNIRSVQNALDRLQVPYFLSSDPSQIEKAEKILFPGVGHAKSAMASLRKTGLDIFLQTTQKPLLGICLGMQMLFDFSEEGETECLGIIPGNVRLFPSDTLERIPHMGWNQAEEMSNSEEYYFVHSYYCDPKFQEDIWMTTECDDFSFCSAVKKKNVWGVQFHPEKSGNRGQKFLQDFFSL